MMEIWRDEHRIVAEEPPTQNRFKLKKRRFAYDNSLADLTPYLRERGVGIINASPTGMGLLTSRGAPAWHPASKAIIEGCRKAVEYCEARGIDLMKLAIQYSCSTRGRPEHRDPLVGS
jgi:aryl-alcohol dehydrogenase-like predicted oxidoreductase